MALVLSFVVKSDSEVVDYEDAFGKMKTVDDITLKGVYRIFRRSVSQIKQNIFQNTFMPP